MPGTCSSSMPTSTRMPRGNTARDTPADRQNPGTAAAPNARAKSDERVQRSDDEDPKEWCFHAVRFYHTSDTREQAARTTRAPTGDGPAATITFRRRSRSCSGCSFVPPSSHARVAMIPCSFVPAAFAQTTVPSRDRAGSQRRRGSRCDADRPQPETELVRVAGDERRGRFVVAALPPESTDSGGIIRVQAPRAA